MPSIFSVRPAGLVLAASLSLASLLATTAVRAHGGDDHAEKPAVAAAGWLPRAEAASEAFELVLVADGEHGWLYLSDFASNQPVANASLTVDIQPAQQQAASQPQTGLTATPTGNAGSYRLDWQPLTEGDYAVTVTFVTADNADVLTMQLPIRHTETFEHVHSLAEFKTPMVWGGGLLALSVVGWIGWRRQQRGQTHA